MSEKKYLLTVDDESVADENALRQVVQTARFNGFEVREYEEREYEERTCTQLRTSEYVPRMAPGVGGYEAPVVICSNCGRGISWDDDYDPKTDGPNYCENCGCKVVGPVKEYE